MEDDVPHWASVVTTVTALLLVMSIMLLVVEIWP